MDYLQPALKPFLIALMASFFLTPAFRLLAWKIGFVDRPSPRKIHGEPIPLLGGLAIYLAFSLALASAGGFKGHLLGILLGAALLLILGLIDDRKGMDLKVKLSGQILAALIVVSLGVRTSFLGSPFLNVPFTILWIVGITNAFNLLDNMDGLSAGLAVISATAFSAIASRYGGLGPEQLPTALASASLAGACLGFLPYNLYKATIFMGDAGSNVLGFILASLAALGNWRSPTLPTSLAIPLLILAYPIFDTILVVILRWRRGQPIYQGGKDHTSHRLVNLGLGKTETVLLIHLFAICHALTAVLVTSVTFRLSLVALAISASILFIFGMVLRKAPV